MTVQPTRDQLRAHLRRLIATWEGPGNPSAPVADLAHLLDQLDAAERRADEAEAKIERLENRAASETARADAWLDRVKRDAAREALDGLADEVTHVNWDLDGPAFALRVRRFKNRNYPEEAP